MLLCFQMNLAKDNGARHICMYTVYITLAPINVGRANSRECYYECMKRNMVCEWRKTKSWKTRVEMFDTCVSCLHCKRLPQNVMKYANVTHAAFAQNTSADVDRRKTTFPRTARWLDSRHNKRCAETRLLIFKSDLGLVNCFTGSVEPSLHRIQISFKLKMTRKTTNISISNT